MRRKNKPESVKGMTKQLAQDYEYANTSLAFPVNADSGVGSLPVSISRWLGTRRTPGRD